MAKAKAIPEVAPEKKVLKVKAILEGYFGKPLPSIIPVGTVFLLNKEKEFSHVWMRAIGWTPPKPSKEVQGLVESSEYKARFAKFVPFDKRTHVNAPLPEGGDETSEDENEENFEDTAPEGEPIPKENEDVL